MPREPIYEPIQLGYCYGCGTVQITAGASVMDCSVCRKTQTFTSIVASVDQRNPDPRHVTLFAKIEDRA